MVYGSGLPALTAGYSGFVNGDTPSSLSTQPTLSTTAMLDSPVSGSPYSITAGGAADPNYTIAYVSGTLTVTPQVITVTSPQTMNSLEASSNVEVTVASGGQLAIDSPLVLASAGSVSVVDNGVLTVPGIDVEAGAVGLNLDGGTLQASGAFTTAAPIDLGTGGGDRLGGQEPDAGWHDGRAKRSEHYRGWECGRVRR